MIRKSPLKYAERDDQPMERSLLLFENSVKSKITFREYLKRLEKFRQFCNTNSFDSLSRIEPPKLQERLEDHIMLRKKQINPNSIPVEFFAIKSFLEINEVELKWRKVATPSEATEELITQIEDDQTISKGTKKDLTGSLKKVTKILDDGKPENDDSACEKLDGFLDYVNEQDGKKLTEEQAAEFRTSGEELKDSLGCL